MLVAFILFSSVICAAVLFGGSLETFFDPISLLFVVGGILSGTIWSFDLNVTVGAFRDAFSGRADTKEQAIQSHAVFDRMANYAAASGLAGTLIGLVQMLQSLDDPTSIGPAMAVALLTLLYGVLLGEFCFRSMANSCLSAHNINLERQERRGFSSLQLTVTGLLLLLITFFVMLTAIC